MPSVRLGWNQQHLLVIAEEFVPPAVGLFLTTNRLFSPSSICFSFRAMASPLLFLTWVFSSFLQAYIIPVARTWQAHTWKHIGDEMNSGAALILFFYLFLKSSRAHLSESPLPQGPVLSECVLGDGLPWRERWNTVANRKSRSWMWLPVKER